MAIAHVGGRGTGVLTAFDLTTGEPKWRRTGEGPAYASPVLLTTSGVRFGVEGAGANRFPDR